MEKYSLVDHGRRACVTANPNMVTKSQKFAKSTWFLRKKNHKTKCCYVKNIVTCLWMSWKEFDGKTEEKLKDSLQLIWPLKYGTFFQTSVLLKLFWPLDRSIDLIVERSSICFADGGLLLALRTSHEMLLCWSAKRSRPRTSDTDISASRIVAGPYFSVLLLGACHFLTFCCTTAWNNFVGFASWPFGGSITTWIFDAWCIKGS